MIASGSNRFIRVPLEWLTQPESEPDPDSTSDWLLLGISRVGSIGFISECDTKRITCVGIAFDGQIPITLIPGFVGRHPENLIEGFTASRKPYGCEWTARSRITSILNCQGSVLVELRPVEGDDRS